MQVFTQSSALNFIIEAMEWSPMQFTEVLGEADMVLLLFASPSLLLAVIVCMSQVWSGFIEVIYAKTNLEKKEESKWFPAISVQSTTLQLPCVK